MPSCSDITPATTAAANSPTLWPMTTSGLTPKRCHKRARAICRANRAGWVNWVWCTALSFCPLNITVNKGMGSHWAICCAMASNSALKAGSASYRARPIPNHWAPWPVNKKAVLPTRGNSLSVCRAPAHTSGDAAPAPSTNTAMRCLKAVRRWARFMASCAAGTSGCVVIQSANCCCCACNPLTDLADITHGNRPNAVAFPPLLSSPSAARQTSPNASFGACSIITWALVPLMPKLLTPARRGRSPFGQGRFASIKRNGLCCQSMRLLG